MKKITVYGYRHFTHKDFPFDIKIRDAQNFNTRMHAHESLQISYMQKGSCIHRIYGVDCKIIKGDILIIPAHVSHELIAAADAAVCLFQVDFMPEMVTPDPSGGEIMDSLLDIAYMQPFLYARSRSVPRLNISARHRDSIEAIFCNMLREFESRQYGYKLSIKADLLKLLVILSRELGDSNGEGLKGQAAFYHQQIFQDITRYIEKNYPDDIKLDDIASIAHMAPAYVSHLFKKVKGISFTDLVNTIRVKKAAEMVAAETSSVTEVCFAVGFKSVAHFNKIFKKLMGVTPTEYRKYSKNR